MATKEDVVLGERVEREPTEMTTSSYISSRQITSPTNAVAKSRCLQGHQRFQLHIGALGRMRQGDFNILNDEHIVWSFCIRYDDVVRYVWPMPHTAGRVRWTLDIMASMDGTRSGCGGNNAASTSLPPATARGASVVGARGAKRCDEGWLQSWLTIFCLRIETL